AAARESTTSAAGSAVRRRRLNISHPFLEGRMGLAGVRSPGFELRAAPSRRAVGSPVAFATHQRPFTVAGPRGIRTRLPWPPAVEPGQHTPPPGRRPRASRQAPRLPLESLAGPAAIV